MVKLTPHPKKELSNDLSDSIQVQRKQKKLLQHAVCRDMTSYGFPMGAPALSRWENASNMPGAYHIVALSHTLGDEGDLAPYVGVLGENPHQQDIDDLSDAFSRALIRTRLLARRRKRAVRRCPFPVALNMASAGRGYSLNDEGFEMLNMPVSSIPRGADFAVYVNGDSMEPHLHDGELAFIQVCPSLRDGEIGLFTLNDDGLIKLFREEQPDEDELDDYLSSEGVLYKKIVLISYNEKYKPIRVLPGTRLGIVGRVL